MGCLLPGKRVTSPLSTMVRIARHSESANGRRQMGHEAEDAALRPALYLVRDAVPERPASTDVYPVLGGGWRATCECGATCSTASPSEGWDWVLEHLCE